MPMLRHFAKWRLPALMALALGASSALARETWESALPQVKQQCAQEWSGNYSMQAYCIREQKKGWDELHASDPPSDAAVPQPHPGFRSSPAPDVRTVEKSNRAYPVEADTYQQ